MEEMMNAIVFSGVGETTYTKVPKPKIQGPNDVLMLSLIHIWAWRYA